MMMIEIMKISDRNKSINSNKNQYDNNRTITAILITTAVMIIITMTTKMQIIIVGEGDNDDKTSNNCDAVKSKRNLYATSLNVITASELWRNSEFACMHRDAPDCLHFSAIFREITEC